jgi:uncharacterized protein YqeY
MALKDRIAEDMKAALKSGERDRLSALRLVHAAIRQREIDDRNPLDDAGVIAVLEKMRKQRRESLAQYEAAGREDLAAVERGEIAVIESYLPKPLGAEELAAAIERAIAATGASGPADLGKVMGRLKAELAGRADFAELARAVRERLAG